MDLKEIQQQLPKQFQGPFNTLVHTLAEQVKANTILQQKIDHLTHAVNCLKKQHFGQSSEKITPETYQEAFELFDEFELCQQVVDNEQSVEESQDDIYS